MGLYTGGYSILLDCGLLDKLDPGDGLMADRGFHVEDECAQRGIILDIPPSITSGKSFTEEEITKTRRIASVRIFVEHMMRRLKE